MISARSLMPTALMKRQMSTRTALTLMWLLATMPLAGGLVYALQETQSILAEQGSRQLRGAARRFEDRFVVSVQRSKELVRLVAALSTQGDVVDCKPVLESFIEDVQDVRNLLVADAEGRVICSARPIPGQLGIRDRSYFEDALASAEPTALAPMAGAGAESGPSLLPIAMMVPDSASGKVVVAAILHLDILAQTLATDLQDSNYALTVWDGSGRVLDRSLHNTGSDVLSATPLSDMTAVAKRGQGTFVSRTDEGEDTIQVTRRIDVGDSSLWLLLESPAGQIYGEVEAIAHRTVPVIGVLVLVCILLGRLISKYALERPLGRIAEKVADLCGYPWPRSRRGLDLLDLGALEERLEDMARSRAAASLTTPERS